MVGRRKNFIILDFEMCRLKGSARKKMCGERLEIIQIGAVMLDQNYKIIDKFSAFVNPQFGTIDTFIEELTGIKAEDVEDALPLRSVLMQFMNWIGDREVMVLSWSDSDYLQLKREMKVKKIRNHKIEELLNQWVDFQYSFDKMLGLKNQFALEKAMKISCVPMEGRQHDGLSDAYNTARLFEKVHKQSAFQLELVPICKYEEQEEHLSFQLGDLFPAELLEQLKCNEKKDEPEEESEEQKIAEKKWSLWRRIYSFMKRTEEVTDEDWNKVLFTLEMKKVDLLDVFQSVFWSKYAILKVSE